MTPTYPFLRRLAITLWTICGIALILVFLLGFIAVLQPDGQRIGNAAGLMGLLALTAAACGGITTYQFRALHEDWAKAQTSAWEKKELLQLRDEVAALKSQAAFADLQSSGTLSRLRDLRDVVHGWDATPTRAPFAYRDAMAEASAQVKGVFEGSGIFKAKP